MIYDKYITYMTNYMTYDKYYNKSNYKQYMTIYDKYYNKHYMIII